MKKEPALISGAIAALVIATVPLVGYLVDWSDGLTALVVGVVGALMAVVSAVITRSKVSPVVHVEIDKVDDSS